MRRLVLAVLAAAAVPATAQMPGPGDGPPHAAFFVDDDFKGGSIVLDGPVPRLSAMGMDDKISSIGVDAGVWEVCVDDDFRGRCEIIDRTVPKLTALGLDDKISSIRPVGPR